MKRYGSIIGVRQEKLEEYVQLHSAVWPEVLDCIHRCNLRNYSIFLRKMPDGKHYLFSYFEYVGTDFAADMAAMGQDPKTKEWWKLTDPCQEALPDRAEGEWWSMAKEVFHVD